MKIISATKATNPDNIPVVILVNLYPELSQILGKSFNLSLKYLPAIFPLYADECSSPARHNPTILFSVIETNI